MTAKLQIDQNPITNFLFSLPPSLSLFSILQIEVQHNREPHEHRQPQQQHNDDHHHHQQQPAVAVSQRSPKHHTNPAEANLQQQCQLTPHQPLPAPAAQHLNSQPPPPQPQPQPQPQP